jgi:hypothetical protein
MSKGGGGSSGTTTQTSTTQLPQWINNAGMANYNAASDVAGNMMGPYSGPLYAGMTPGATADVGALQGSVGGANPGYNLAQSTLSGLQGFAPDQVNPGSLASTDLSPYMNPFTQAVIDPSLQALDRQRLQAQNTNADQAISQGAFGGSRQGVQEGVTNAASAAAAGQLVSGLQSQNFGNAQTQAQSDLTRNLAGQEANQNAEIQGAGINLNAANSGASVAGAQQQSLLQSLMAALQGQTMVQGDQQGQINANQQAYSAQQQFPLQQLQILEQSLGQTPYGQTTTQTSQLPPSNGLMSGLGAGAAGLGILGSVASMFPGIGTAIGGLLNGASAAAK